MLGCEASEVMFTSCGSEADNHAIASAVGPGRHCLPRRPTHSTASFLEGDAILRLGEQHLSGPSLRWKLPTRVAWPFPTS
jgi:cysteine sulfinate desulfinase/cysteine desulfurase-like protein